MIQVSRKRYTTTTSYLFLPQRPFRPEESRYISSPGGPRHAQLSTPAEIERNEYEFNSDACHERQRSPFRSTLPSHAFEGRFIKSQRNIRTTCTETLTPRYLWRIYLDKNYRSSKYIAERISLTRRKLCSLSLLLPASVFILRFGTESFAYFLLAWWMDKKGGMKKRKNGIDSSSGRFL